MALMGSGPWKKILFILYRYRLIVHKDYQKQDIEHPSKNIGMDKYSFNLAISFLEEHNLITLRDDDFYYLTTQGFKVAFELEKQKREEREKNRFEIIQWLMIIFTCILAISSIINIFY
ncbi:MAG: hypothetical protein OQK82_06825 [Candidatus Pacearchaeota archaeon]|nr:hypothetical protein [Candidatus Pacearchaeota archaeon]